MGYPENYKVTDITPCGGKLKQMKVVCYLGNTATKDGRTKGV